MARLESHSIRANADRIFRQVLLQDERLQLPLTIASFADKTSFVATDTIDEPYLPVPWKFTESSAALWALAATVGNVIVNERFGITQGVRINTDLASLFLTSAGLVRVDGKPLNDPDLASRYLKYDLGRSVDPYRRLCTNVYRTRDNRYFHLHGSMNADKSMSMVSMPLEYDGDRSHEAIVAKYAEKVAELDSEWLDNEANNHLRQAGTVCLTEEEFRASPQGLAIRDDGLYTIKQTERGILPPIPFSKLHGGKARPLEGLRLLDLSRVIAGPTISKLAALFGATVVRVSCQSQPDMGPLLVEGNLGKRDVSLDLKSGAGREAFKLLLFEADIVLDGFRPGALERLGFGVPYMQAVAKRRGKGIIIVRENCYGWHGPWVGRSGWQQISDCFTGVSYGMGEFLGLDEPVVPPLPNSDYQTGLVGAIGILVAVYKRATEGGSYVVDVSLTQYNQFLISLGKQPTEVQENLRKLHPEFRPRHYHEMISLTEQFMRTARHNIHQLFKEDYFRETGSYFNGREGKSEVLRYVGPAAEYETTQLSYDVGSCFLDTYPAEWPASELNI